jgi:beta-glucanase (GH16 family)
MVRDDEFTATGLDSSLWSAGWFPRMPDEVTAPEGPFNLACYDPTYVSQPGDGNLHLRLARTASTCGGGPKSYTGSMVTTREQFSQLGGAYEARIYVPGNRQGQAAGWPSWWLNGQSSTPYPAHGEVDIMEGWAARTSAILHYDDGTGRDPNLAWTPPANYLGWHTFGLAWTYTASQKSVTWYWDGAAVLTRNWPVTTPQYLVLSMAIAQPSGLPDGSSVEMLVDWVRVWK